MPDKTTADEALILVSKFVQQCRESGETDLRSVLGYVRGLRVAINDGATYAQLLSDLEQPE